MRLRSLALILLCAACSPTAATRGAPADAGPGDAGSTPDAGPLPDAGAAPDAGGLLDAGAEPDAGIAPDAGGEPDAGPVDAGTLDAGSEPDAGPGPADAGPVDAGPPDAGSNPDAGSPADAGPPCTTTITYGNAWLRPAGHSDDFDVVRGPVTWDGACVASGANSYAVLSNGWKPYFTGHGRCVIALDTQGCGAPAGCTTRATYGSAWLPPANHPNSFDDVTGRLLWDGECTTSGGSSSTTLSNGWTPHFSGSDACEVSLRYQECGGLYANPVGPGCADPGVLKDGSTYYMVCTGGGSAKYPRFTSTDLVHWSAAGHIFSAATTPSWAIGKFWAPEIHKVGSQYVAYFTAQHSNGQLAIGAATASSPAGPFTDIGAPLVHPAGQGAIDASEFEDAAGTPYLLWKIDGNATGQPTPIYAQQLAPDGLSRVGTAVQLITNDLGWEGNVTEGPWMIRHGGYYYLFYSGNSYANSTYAIGVARATSPLGPFTKHGPPIVTTKAGWVGPGHCSVVPGPSGAWALVYHAWMAGAVNTSGASRYPLVDTLRWVNDWPEALVAPTETSQPLP